MPKPALAKFAGTPAPQSAGKAKTKQVAISSFFAPMQSKGKDKEEPMAPAPAASPPAKKPAATSSAETKKRARAVVISSDSEEEEASVAHEKRAKTNAEPAASAPSPARTAKATPSSKRAAEPDTVCEPVNSLNRWCVGEVLLVQEEANETQRNERMITHCRPRIRGRASGGRRRQRGGN